MRFNVILNFILRQIYFFCMVLFFKSFHVYKSVFRLVNCRVKELKIRPRPFNIFFNRIPDFLVIIKSLPNWIVFSWQGMVFLHLNILQFGLDYKFIFPHIVCQFLLNLYLIPLCGIWWPHLKQYSPNNRSQAFYFIRDSSIETEFLNFFYIY